MVYLLVILSRQSNCSAPSSRLSASSPVTKSPVVHPVSVQPLTKCSSRNSFVLTTIHFDGGCIPCLLCPLTTAIAASRYPIPYPLSFHILAHSLALFCTRAEFNSFLFTRFRTLRQKTRLPGAGGASAEGTGEESEEAAFGDDTRGRESGPVWLRGLSW